MRIIVILLGIWEVENGLESKKWKGSVVNCQFVRFNLNDKFTLFSDVSRVKNICNEFNGNKFYIAYFLFYI